MVETIVIDRFLPKLIIQSFLFVSHQINSIATIEIIVRQAFTKKSHCLKAFLFIISHYYFLLLLLVITFYYIYSLVITDIFRKNNNNKKCYKHIFIERNIVICSSEELCRNH